MPTPDPVVVRPRLASSILFLAASAPLWGLGLYIICTRSWLGLGLIALCALVWVVSIGGVRIVAAEDTVEFRRLFWSEWKLPLNHLVVHRRFGGDLLPAYLLVDARGEHGTILTLPFEPLALRGLIGRLLSRGATLR